MPISVIGTGYVGLVSGACLSEFGLQVTCMDNNKNTIDHLLQGEIPIYEPGLKEIVEKNYKAGRLRFTTSYEEAVSNATTVFIAVGTPPREDGSADLQYVLSAARSIAEHMDGYKVIVDKSTVPVGTGRKVKEVIQQVLDERGVDYPFDVVSNPEFLREGSAVGDFMRPDRIVIGCESERAEKVMQEVYRVLYLNNHPFVFTNIETAEVIKYASNAFLATKITFANEMANLCDAVGADVKAVSKAMGLDKRIGKYFLHAGPGYGGSCFPKDTRALAMIGDEAGVEISVVKSVIAANERQKLRMVDKVTAALGDLERKIIAVLGLSFKPETDDVRDAPATTIIRELVRRGAVVKAFDPIAMNNSKRYALEGLDIEYAADEYAAAAGADALILVTEWNQFRSMELSRLRQAMRGNSFFDLRNIYEPETMESAGFNYYGVGRGRSIKAEKRVPSWSERS